MKRSLALIFVACMLGMMSSCGLINSALKVPAGLLKSVGRTAGINSLTDDKPQPERPLEIEKAEQTSSAPQATSSE